MIVRAVVVPRGPPLILHRYSPIGVSSPMPDVQMVVMTTPFAFAGHIICLLTRTWGERIAPAVREALYIAMKVRLRRRHHRRRARARTHVPHSPRATAVSRAGVGGAAVQPLHHRRRLRLPGPALPRHLGVPHLHILAHPHT